MPTKSVILIDFDNVFLGLWRLDAELAQRFANEPMEWLPRLASTHLTLDQRRWLVARCYLNPAGWVQADETSRLYFSRYRAGLVRAGFDVIDCPSITGAGKNAADIRMVIDALDLLKSDSRYDEFVIASSDSDFVPLLQRIRAHDRYITVISPGNSSSAYRSLADNILDFTAMDNLIWPEAAPEEAIEITDAPKSGVDGDKLKVFSGLVLGLYQNSSAPLNLASLAQETSRVIPGAREDGWFGAGSFSNAIDRLKLPNARRSQYFLWDEDRHQAPISTDRNSDSSIPAVITTMMRVIDLPRITKEKWRPVFDTLARYAAEHDFNLTEATRWSRDTLEAMGERVGRPTLGFVIRGVSFGGAPLNRVPAPSADELADAFYHNVVGHARDNGIEIDAAAEVEIADWFGLPVSREVKEPSDATSER